MEFGAQLDENPMAWEQCPQSESFYYNESDIKLKLKEELIFEDSQSQSVCDSGSESPPTLTTLDNVGYITGDGNALLAGDDSGFADRYSHWNNIEPAGWDSWQVQNWLQQFSMIDCNAFADLNGETLCELTLEDFMHRDPANGGVLYNELQQLLYPQTYPYVQQPNYHPNFPTDFEGGEALDSLGRLMKAYSLDGTEPLPSIPAPKEEKPVVKQERMFDDDMSSPSSPAESDISSTSSKPTGRRNSRGKGKLWEFIRDLLLDSATCPTIIKWENRSEGIFRIVKSDQVAQLWGKRKCNKSMTYEKMSRAMRYYYKKGVLERIECRRLVYKFGDRSRGWQL